MKTGVKIALTTIGAAIVVVVVYRLLKTKASTSLSVQASGNGLASTNKKMDVGGIGKITSNVASANKADRFADMPVVNKADRFVDVPVVNKADRF